MSLMIVGHGTFSQALKSDGSVWTWGNNGSGVLGDNTIINRSSPVSVVGAHSFILIGCGSSHAMGLKSDGSAWGWGNAGAGRIGSGSVADRSSPFSVLGGHSFIVLQPAISNSIAIRGDTICFTWGTNSLGLLGDQSTLTQALSPISIIGPIGGPPKSVNNIQPGDRLIWNAFASGLNLAATDRFDFNYLI
jgi:alpha-tubulin suppressor-like RCC1 family protein